MFSIVIPVYNRSAVLKRAIQSALDQTFKDFEVIVVDDGSSEDVAAVAHSFQDKRISVTRLPHMGGNVARNVGIAQSRFDWIAFLDSDDRWAENKLEKFHAYVSKNPESEIIYSGFTYWDAEKDLFYPKIDMMPDNITSVLLVKNVVHGTSLIVVKKKLLLQIDGFDIRLKARQDIDLYVRLGDLKPFHFIPESLCFITFTAEKRISKNPANRLQGYLLFFKKHRHRMNGRQRSYTSKRILYFALQCRKWRTAFRYFWPAIPSLIKT